MDILTSGSVMSETEQCLPRIRCIVLKDGSQHLEQLYQIITTHAPHGYCKATEEWRRIPVVEQ